MVKVVFRAYLRQKWIDLRQTKTKMIIDPFYTCRSSAEMLSFVIFVCIVIPLTVYLFVLVSVFSLNSRNKAGKRCCTCIATGTISTRWAGPACGDVTAGARDVTSDDGDVLDGERVVQVDVEL